VIMTEYPICKITRSSLDMGNLHPTVTTHEFGGGM
jgi:hypothetical protein